MTTNTTNPSAISHRRGDGCHVYTEEVTGRTVAMIESMFTVGNPAAAEFIVSVSEPAPEGETGLERTRRSMTEPRFSIPVGGLTWTQQVLDALAARLLAADPETLPHNYAEKRGFDFLEDLREPCPCGDCDGWHWATA